MCNIKPAVALREGPLPASGRLRGPSLRVCCLGISVAPRRRDGLAGRDRASSSLVVMVALVPGGILQGLKTMSLLGTSTSLRSVTGCLVAGPGVPPISYLSQSRQPVAGGATRLGHGEPVSDSGKHVVGAYQWPHFVTTDRNRLGQSEQQQQTRSKRRGLCVTVPTIN